MEIEVQKQRFNTLITTNFDLFVENKSAKVTTAKMF
jgi:hypothetical protein